MSLDSSAIAMDESFLPQNTVDRLAHHLCRRQRRHAAVVGTVHAAGQAIRTVGDREEILPLDPDRRRPREAQLLGLLLRGHFDEADRRGNLSLRQELTEPLHREIVRGACLPIPKLDIDYDLRNLLNLRDLAI